MNFLPGWFPAIATSGGPLTSITLFASTTSPSPGNSSTITLPSGINRGDLIVIADSAMGSTTPSAVTPSGFTAAITSVNALGIRLCASYKLADGTESGASVTGMAGNGGYGAVKVCYVFRGNRPATVIGLGSPASQGTNNDPSSQNVTASGGTPPLVVFGFYTSQPGGSGLVNPRSFSTTKDGEIEGVSNGSDDGDLWMAYKIYDLAPADTTVDMQDEGSNCLGSCYLTMSNT